MKPIFFVVLLVGIALVVGGILALNHFSNSDKSQLKSTWIESKYQANEVIAVAQAQYPVCHRGIGANRTESPTIITVQYKGDGIWKVDISCPSLFFLEDNTSSKVLYFHESDGALNSWSWEPKYK
jgi:hypothetical protein